MSTLDKTKELETKDIKKLLWDYALPAVASQVVTSIYNIVDSVFLGNSTDGNGKLYLAALAITFPVMNIIHAFGSLVGAGSSARMSIVLGRKDVRWAEKILGNSVLLTFLFGILFVTAGYLWTLPIMTLFGEDASPAALSKACEYMYIVLPGMFLLTLTFNLVGLIRASGYPMKGMWIMIGGSICNILLDYLFINVMGMGLKGAAWGTTFSMGLAALVAVHHFIQPKSFIRFRKHAWAPKLYIFRNILAIGISPFSMNVAAFAVVAVLNAQLTHYGGDDAVAVYGVANRATGLIFMILLGLCQAMQPIAGYNYGARRNDRLKEIYIQTMKVCLVIGFGGMAASMLIPGAIIRCFSNAPEIISMGIPALRYLMVFAPLIAFSITNSQLFQSIDQPWIAIVTSLSRQVILLIPISLVLPGIMYRTTGDGVTGVWLSCTICDFLGAVLSAVLLITHRQVFRMDYIPPTRKPRKEMGPKESSEKKANTTFKEVSLLPYNTFGIDAKATRFAELRESSDFTGIIKSSILKETPFFILGGGSNVVFVGDCNAIVLHPANKGIRVVDEDSDKVVVEAAAGEVWADFVDYCIGKGWHGLENMAAIPGNVGAAPVQNVGAYGTEAKDVVRRVHCYNIETGSEEWIDSQSCHFGYRTSAFKKELKNKYIIDRVEFALTKSFVPNLSYKALADALAADGITSPTAIQVADCVKQLRSSKLPDPKEIGSAGSFFKNPVVSEEQYSTLRTLHPDLPAHSTAEGGYKLAAAWLIEQCGWKGKTMGHAGVYEKQALVLVNRGGCSGQEVRDLSKAIAESVKEKFGVDLECEAIFIEL